MSKRLRFIHKTFLEEADLCGRLPYLRRFFMGQGVQKDSAPQPSKNVGTAIHKGVEVIFLSRSLDKAQFTAIDEWRYETKDAWRFVPDHIAAVQKIEYEALIMQVLDVWHRTRYRTILAGYDVLTAEQKSFIKLTEELKLIAKPDAILVSHLDGRLYDHSLKTSKSYNRIKHPQALIDHQGLTETVAVAVDHAGGKLSQVGGVLMEYIIVGSMDDDEPLIWHPALRGWRRVTPSGFEYAWRWKFPNPDYDPTAPRSPKKNPKDTSLRKDDGWERTTCWDYPGGQSAWVEDLLARRFVPFHIDPVSELIFAPEPYVRSEGQIESFVAQTVAYATAFNAGLDALDAGTPIDALNVFRQHKSACLKFGEDYRCDMWDICWKGAGADPFGSGYVQHRSSLDKEKDRENTGS